LCKYPRHTESQLISSINKWKKNRRKRKRSEAKFLLIEENIKSNLYLIFIV